MKQDQNILIAESDSDVKMQLSELLSKSGYHAEFIAKDHIEKLSREAELSRKVLLNIIEDEKELAREKALLSYTIEQSVNEIYIFDADTLRFKYVNQGAITNLGYSLAQLRWMTPFDIKTLYTEESYRDTIEPLLNKEKKVLYFETIQQRADGSTYPVKVNLQFSEFSGERVFLAVIQDITENRKIRDELLEAKLRYEDLYENSPDMLLSVETETNSVLICNDTFCRKTGFEKNEIIGHSVFNIYHPDYIENIRANLEEFNKTGYIYNKELKLLKKDGSAIDIILNSAAIRDENNKIVRSRSSLIDISEKKKIENELKESEEKFSKAFKSAPYGLVITSIEKAEIIDCNDHFSILSGYSQDELIGQSTLDLKLWAIESDRDAIVSELKQNKRVVAKEIQFGTKNGKILTCLFYAELIKLNDEVYVLSSISDISDRKKAEKEIQESEARFRSIIESSPMGMHIYELNEQDQLIFIGANPAADTILGVDHSFFIGKTIEEAFPSLIGSVVPEQYKKIARTNCIWKTEQIEYDDGKVKGAFEVVAFQISKNKMAAKFNEVTARKIADEKIRRFTEELEELVKERTAGLESANKELEAFAYSVSHDLRAPLRAINGFINILTEDYGSKLDVEAQRVCSVINENSKHLGQLIDDLLSFSKFSRSAINLFAIQMQALVHHVYNEVATLEQKEKVQLIVNQIPEVVGDHALINQVWVNLIANALKFSSLKSNPIIEIGCNEEDENLTFWIKDNGVGFDMKYVDKIFDVFQRLHKKEEFEGTGVGLAIVQRIIQRHEGKVWAEGELDKGACFYFSLPNPSIKRPA